MTPEALAKSGSEDGHQAALFCWAAKAQQKWPMLAWLHAVPNGGQRGGKHGAAAAGAKMKTTGVKSGVWDVFLPVPTYAHSPQGYCCPGLYIEMKKPGVGKLSPNQKTFQKHVAYYGYQYATCWSWTEAKDVIEKYLEQVTPEQAEHYKEWMSN